MLLSQYFLPVIKDNPREAKIISHRLMLKAGLIRQHCTGIYNWLPLGLKVLRKVEDVIRFNMNAISAVEMLMPCIQSSKLWEQSGRIDTYGSEMLKMVDRHDHQLLFGPTNEEVITDIVKNNIKSYKDLPKILYQIQWKFRDEIRPRFGVMRGREFLMKDAYSIDQDQESAINTYNIMFAAYMSIFRDLGLSVIPLRADTGEIGGDMSHEFHVVAKTGESLLYYDKKFDLLSEDLASDINNLKNIYSAADEQHDPKTCPVDESDLVMKRGIEVGHIFNFDTKYSLPMKANISKYNGEISPVYMGAYGIGVSRLVGAIIEASHDDKGIIWPENVAPFDVSLINLNIKNQNATMIANDLYYKLKENNIDVLYDDTDATVGSKFATHDLIGMPWQIIIGKKIENNIVELKHRKTGEVIEANTDNVHLHFKR